MDRRSQKAEGHFDAYVERLVEGIGHADRADHEGLLSVLSSDGRLVIIVFRKILT